jgi:penicillin-binding protein 2
MRAYLMFIILERQALRVEGIDIAGKTGTAEKLCQDWERIQLKDHSIFVAFAPKDNPKIAIAILVKMEGLERQLDQLPA